MECELRKELEMCIKLRDDIEYYMDKLIVHPNRLLLPVVIDGNMRLSTNVKCGKIIIDYSKNSNIMCSICGCNRAARPDSNYYEYYWCDAHRHKISSINRYIKNDSKSFRIYVEEYNLEYDALLINDGSVVVRPSDSNAMIFKKNEFRFIEKKL